MARIDASSDDQIVDGTSEGDEIYSNDFNNLIVNGLEGRDIIFAGASTGSTFNGGDGGGIFYAQQSVGGIFNGGAGGDGFWGSTNTRSIFNGGEGDDTVRAWRSADSIFNGDIGNETFFAEKSTNSVFNGGGGSDSFYGSDDTNTIFNGGDGQDYISAGDDTGVFWGSSTGSIFNGDAGSDTFSGAYSTNCTYNGGAGHDVFITEDSSNSVFNGDVGNDVFYLTYYRKGNIYNGGAGADTAYFGLGINDYAIEQNDETFTLTWRGVVVTVSGVETFAFYNNLTGEYDEYVLGEPPCFLPGTMIATPSGEVAIETLKAGDLVLTTQGEAKPVRWLARQTMSTRFANPQRVMPILVRAGALGAGVPVRDLHVSPDHALEIEGLLVHAEALVNGSSIVRHTAMPERFTYYHVELDDHSLILAEGAPAETFIDNVTRRSFDNWQEAPDAPVAGELEHPRVKSARQLPRSIRHWLAIRAKALGHAEVAA